MSVRTIDFSSSAYAKTKSFKAKENNATASRIKEKNPPSGVKSSWTPLKQDLNEKVCVEAFIFLMECFSYALQIFEDNYDTCSLL